MISSLADSPVAISKPWVCEGCLVPTQGPERVGPRVPPHCTCPACTDWRTRWAELAQMARPRPCEAPLMVIGMAPGDEEVQRGEPFVGPSGRQLSAALRWAGIDPTAPICKLNVVNCRTLRPGVTKLVNRDPTAAEAHECLNRIGWPLLHNYQGLVLVLGGFTYKALTQERFGTFGQARGHRLEWDTTAIARTIEESRPGGGRVVPVRVVKGSLRHCGCGQPLAPRRRKCDRCRQ